MYRVLVADDSAYMRGFLSEILREEGYDVIGQAAGGYNAVEIFKALKPDIVMLDAAMPGVDGIEALKNIMAIDRAAIVIILTVVGKPQIVLEAMAGGARSYLTKPFDTANVLQAIRQATAIKQ
jgi:CheY-like chemotaxis protein